MLKSVRKRLFRQRPLLSAPQLLVLLSVIVALFFALDLNRRAQAGKLVGVGEEALVNEIAVDSTRQVELQATLEYVHSDDYVADYARYEANQILPGEVRYVPLLIEATVVATPSAAEATPDPGIYARPWQAWWQLLTDAPLPAR